VPEGETNPLLLQRAESIEVAGSFELLLRLYCCSFPRPRLHVFHGGILDSFWSVAIENNIILLFGDALIAGEGGSEAVLDRKPNKRTLRLTHPPPCRDVDDTASILNSHLPRHPEYLVQLDVCI
jgi:hypothetical protein